MAAERVTMMNDGADYIREFLAHMGVKADVKLDSTCFCQPGV